MRAKVFKTVLVLLLCGLAVTAWRGLRTEKDDGPIIIRLAGTTNFNERTFVLFAITNRQEKGVRGYVYPIMLGDDGWIEARAAASGMSYKNQRDIWLAPASSAPHNGAVIWIALPTTNVWRVVLNGMNSGTGRVPARQRTIMYLLQHRHFRLARWLMPPPPKPGTERFEDPFGQCSLGPEMRGTKLR